MGKKGNSAAQLIIDDLQLPLSQEQYFIKLNKIFDYLFPTAAILPGGT